MLELIDKKDEKGIKRRLGLLKTNRIRHIDIAKGIAMISIVIGHLGLVRVNQIVFTYHLPIFYLISGYFINTRDPYKDFVKKKFKSLIIPYALTCLAIIVLSIPRSIYLDLSVKEELWRWLFASLYGAGNSYQDPFVIPKIGAIWFLWATFWGELLFRKLIETKRGTRIVTVILCLILSVWSTRLIWLPFSIQAGLCSVIFMYVGYLFRQNWSRMKEILDSETRTMLVLCGVALWIYMMRNFAGFWLVKAHIGRGFVDIIASICGSGIILLIAFWIDKNSSMVSRVLNFYGRYSLLVLCLHIIELNIFPWWDFYKLIFGAQEPKKMVYIAFLIGVKFIFITVGVYILRQIPMVRRMFGYEKR